MGFLPRELQEFLIADPDVRILIVEGRTDIAVWHYLVPAGDRKNCVIYAIDDLDVPVAVDGNRGAALNLAAEATRWRHTDRIIFFIDADNDHVLGRLPEQNTILTDFRDMESYVLLDSVLEHLCAVGASENPVEIARTKSTIAQTLRPVGLLRIASARHSYDLPFARTFQDGRLQRFFDRRRQEYELSVTRTLDALLQSAGRSRTEAASILSEFEAELNACTALPDRLIVHGKDLTAFISWYFDMTLEMAGGMIKLCLGACVDQLRPLPNLSRAIRWLQAA